MRSATVVGGVRVWASIALLGLWGLGCSGDSRVEAAAEAPEVPVVDPRAPEAPPGAEVVGSTDREGLHVEFAVARPGGGDLMHGDQARLEFRITDRASGDPVEGLYPAAWLDLVKSPSGHEVAGLSCKDRVGMYLQGTVGMRPLVDMNSYFVLSMNRDATISVIDPLVGISGITKLYAQVNLKKPGADWTLSADHKKLYVTMPEAGEVAFVDTERFRVIRNLPAGENPTRIGLQRDERYLWVGNDGEGDAQGGVTAIDLQTLRVIARIPTGRGHHEIAISDDDRFVYVTNRGSGTVTVIDVRRLEKVGDVRTGPLPIAVAWSSLARAFYVPDGESGEIAVLEPGALEISGRIGARPGLGPIRFSQDGRWGLVVNAREDVVHVVDASTNRITHTLETGKRPYQVAFSRAFGYVRSLGTEQVQLIELQYLSRMSEPPVVKISIGAKAPEIAPDLSIADAIEEAPGEAAVLVVSPGDDTVYYYMEGMNAAAGNFRNYGHRPRAVRVVDRALRETSPGIYTGAFEVPDAGTYDVAFLLDAPRVLHCFQVVARANPILTPAPVPLAVEYLIEDRHVVAGETLKLRFRLTEPQSGKPRGDVSDVRVLYYPAPGSRRDEADARAVEGEDGIYEVDLPIHRLGAYYIRVAAPSIGVDYETLPFLTLISTEDGKPSRLVPAGERG